MTPDSPSRCVLVTGAAHRIGREIALAFGRAGWQVAVHYGASAQAAADTVAALEAQGSSAAAFDADLQDPAAIDTLVPRVVRHFGRLDAVVNNASRFEYDNAASFSAEQLQSHLGPNLIAPIVLARDLAQHLADQPAAPCGVVINLLDQKLWNYNPDFLSYTLTKAALEAATTMLAQSLAPRVRVVGVAPGLTLPSHLQDEAAFARTHQMSPLGAGSSPETIADAVLFAARNPAITGTTLLVDGGQHLQRFERDFSMMQP